MSLYKLNYMSLILGGFDEELGRSITSALCPAGLSVVNVHDNVIIASNASTMAIIKVNQHGFRISRILKRTEIPENARILDEKTPIPFNRVNEILKILDRHNARITDIRKGRGYIIIETDKNLTIKVSYVDWRVEYFPKT